MNFGRKKKTAAYPWRQNFRDEKLLPDLKIVRTHFIYNAVTVGLLCVFLGLFIYQEYDISVRAEVLKGLQAEVRKETPADKKNQADSANFSRDLNRVMEGVRFADAPVRPELFFAELAKAQVPNGRYVSMSFSRVATDEDPAMASYQLTLDGSMAPTAENSAPAEIGAFIGKLRGMPVWKNCERNVELVTSAPSEDLSIFNYTIKLTWKAGNKEVAK